MMNLCIYIRPYLPPKYVILFLNIIHMYLYWSLSSEPIQRSLSPYYSTDCHLPPIFLKTPLPSIFGNASTMIIVSPLTNTLHPRHIISSCIRFFSPLIIDTALHTHPSLTSHHINNLLEKYFSTSSDRTINI